MNLRTDLAHEQAQAMQASLPEGVQILQEQAGENPAVAIHIVKINTPKAAEEMHKPVGTYITVEGSAFGESTTDDEAQIIACTQKLTQLLPPSGLVLIIGLGNRAITPDALGPMVVEHIIATRHIEGETAKQAGLEDMRSVAAIAPGILGQTGMEAGDIATWICQSLKPQAVIAIDALAAGSLERLGRTIQIADVGIIPGSGVRGSRKAINREHLGVPVLSVGVPTVIDSTVLLQQAGVDIHALPQNAALTGSMVTPHNVDMLIARSAKIVATAINMALQKHLSAEDVRFLMS